MKKKDRTVTYELTINLSSILQWVVVIGVGCLYVALFILLFKYHGII